MKDHEIVIIGAGKTGRGFIGRLLREVNQEFLLVDKNPELVKQLRRKGQYMINFFGDGREPLSITNYTAESTESPQAWHEIKYAKLIFIAVGGSNLETLAGYLAKPMEERLKENDEQCTFILCENATKPAEKMKQELLYHLTPEYREKAKAVLGFSEATVFCTTIEVKDDPINILSEDYPRLPCDARGLKDNIPEIKGLEPIQNFDNFLLRKIYTYNSASALISYLGWQKGYTVYSDAANDPVILEMLHELYHEVGKALCKVYGYRREEQEEFAALSLKKFRDRTIKDTIARNAREPYRKLAYNERIIGPVNMILETGGDCTVLAVTAAAALLYEDDSDAEWNQMKEELGAEEILRQICRVDPASDLGKMILMYYMQLSKKPASFREIK